MAKLVLVEPIDQRAEHAARELAKECDFTIAIILPVPLFESALLPLDSPML